MREPQSESSIPTFDQLLRDPGEQFDVRSEMLASVLSYLSAPSSTAGTQVWNAAAGRGHAWLFAASPTTGATAASNFVA